MRSGAQIRGRPRDQFLKYPNRDADKRINSPVRRVAMNEPVQLAQKVMDLEAKVRQLEIASFILNIILAIFFLVR